MQLTAPAQAARRALLQRFLALSGVLAVAVLLFLAATSRSQAFNPEVSPKSSPSSAAWNCYLR